MKTFTIEKRHKRLINTDPQRRCYDGCYFSSEWGWTGWHVLETHVPEDRIDKRLRFWRELNDYAISQRGESARAQFRKVEYSNA